MLTPLLTTLLPCSQFIENLKRVKLLRLTKPNTVTLNSGVVLITQSVTLPKEDRVLGLAVLQAAISITTNLVLILPTKMHLILKQQIRCGAELPYSVMQRVVMATYFKRSNHRDSFTQVQVRHKDLTVLLRAARAVNPLIAAVIAFLKIGGWKRAGADHLTEFRDIDNPVILTRALVLEIVAVLQTTHLLGLAVGRTPTWDIQV